MIKDIIHDPLLLAQRSVSATKLDLKVAQDLKDTLIAHRTECVGMAANMIGINKRLIVFLDESKIMPKYTIMFNPEIVEANNEYDTQEGCLSLLGSPRQCKRFHSIKVRFQNSEFKWRTETYTGWTAQIIQHEIDHCNGILI